MTSVRRRRFLIAAGVAVSGPYKVFAQQSVRARRIGVLSQHHIELLDPNDLSGTFRQRMRELGHVEGKNLIIEWRSAENKLERLPSLAAELANLGVDVIVA